VCLNPKDIPPDDLDEEILGRMIKEAGMFYKMELEKKAKVTNTDSLVLEQI